MQIENIYLYRMTHIENIPHILKYGITHQHSVNKNPNYRSIGDVTLISTRKEKVINVETEGGERQITLGDYIPFYFGIKMPMLYVIEHGGNFVPNPVPPAEIVYIVCKLTEMLKEQTEYYYTNGHATDNLTTFYGKDKIAEIAENVNWDAVKTRYWGGEENLRIKAQKQAEFLVKDDVPAKFLSWILCFDENSRQKLIEMGAETEKIKIYPKAYY